MELDDSNKGVSRCPIQNLQTWDNLEVGVVLVGQGLVSGGGHLVAVLLHEGGIDLHLRRSKGGSSNEFQRGVADQLPGKPQEGLLEVIVGLGGDVVVLEVLLAVEGDGLGLHLTLLNIDLVTAKDNRNVLADTDEITVPVGNVLVGDTGGNIEHDDTTLSVDIISISQTTELLLTSCVPNVELDCAQVRGEFDGVNLDTKSSDVLLLEFTSEVALDESGLRREKISG